MQNILVSLMPLLHQTENSPVLTGPWIFILNDISACRKQCLLCLTYPWILLRCYFGQISDIINPYSGLLEGLVVNGCKRKTRLSLARE